MIEFVAGVIDARGHIELLGRHGALSPRLRVTTARVDLLEWLAAHTAVSIRKDDRGYDRRACAEHCDDTHVHTVRQSASWTVDGARAVVVLFNVLPYLVCQLIPAHSAIRNGVVTWRERTEVTEQMRRLGWEIPAADEVGEAA